MSLIAAGRASMRCLARHTSPMPPCAEAIDQVVASELASAADLGAQRVDDACTDVGHDHDEQVGEYEREKKL